VSTPTYAKATVIVLRAPVKTVHGSEVYDWKSTAVARTTFGNALVLAAATSEDLDHREALRGTYDVFLPEFDSLGKPADLLGTDKVILPNGREYRIVGEPEFLESATGALNQWQLLCERWAG
jgi:hypothetical protein